MELSWTEFAAIGFAVIALGVLFVSFKSKEHDVAIAVHKWALRIATAFSKAGASSIVVTPFNDVAVDNFEAAIGHGETAAEYLEHPENWAKELMNMVVVGLADPVLKPKLLKLFNDAAGGASAQTLQADAKDVVDSSPLNDIDQANADLKDKVEHIFSEAHHPELSGVFDKLPAGQKFLSKLAISGKTVAARAATAVSPPAAAALAAIPDGHILLGPGATLPSTTSTSQASPAKPNADGTPVS